MASGTLIVTNDWFHDPSDIAVNTDLNDLTTGGIYVSKDSATSSTLINTPYTGAGFSLFVTPQGTNGAVHQYIAMTSSFYVRRRSSGTWSDWKYISGTWNFTFISAITASGQKIKFSGSAVLIVVLHGNTEARCGMYIVYCGGSTSTPFVSTIKACSNATITPGSGNGELTIAGSSIGCTIIPMSDSANNRFTVTAVS